MTTFILCVVAFVVGIAASEIPAVRRVVAKIRAETGFPPRY